MDQSIYTRYSVNRLIFIFSLPAILSLIVELLTGVVDTAFAGHIGNGAGNALAAMGLVSPLIAIFVAIQSLFAVSTAIMVSSLLGKQDRIALDQHVQVGLMMTIVLNTLISFGVWLVLDGLLIRIGASGEVLTLAKEYLQVLLISNIFSSVGYLLTSIIRAFGHPKTEMVIISISVVLNIIANAFLTFGLDLGMTGIALGTLVSELVCVIIAAIWLKKNNLWFTYRAQSFTSTIQITGQLAIIGSVQTVLQSLAGITAFFVNRQLLDWAGSAQVGSWAVANKVYMLLLMPIIGLTQSVQSILAYFNGSGNRKKQRSVSVKTIWLSSGYGVAAAVISFFAGSWLAGILAGSAERSSEASDMMNILFVTFPLVGITYTIITLLQVTGREKQSLFIACFRQILVVIPLVLLLPNVIHYFLLPIKPAFAVIAAIPLADLLTLIVALYLGRKTTR